MANRSQTARSGHSLVINKLIKKRKFVLTSFLVKVSLSLLNGAFGAIGANGDNGWRQWMLHCRQWRHSPNRHWRQWSIHWHHSLSPLSPLAPNDPFTKLYDTFTKFLSDVIPRYNAPRYNADLAITLPDVVWPAAAERQPRARSARRGCCVKLGQREIGPQRQATITRFFTPKVFLPLLPR